MSVAPSQASAAGAASRPWRRAVWWLVVLGTFFFASYGAANWLASLRGEVGSIAFSWERHIPFLPWTIIPYWSIDLFYALSVFVAGTRAELDILGRRLLTAQIVAVACFILFPLRFAFGRPDSDGLAGFLFEMLASFDKPYNQAPSLHVALAVVLWQLYVRHAPRPLLLLLHCWFGLIVLSVLTTYQHHFIDVPTGALLGLFCLWLWPERGPSPVSRAALARDPVRWRLASCYVAGAAVAATAALSIGGAALWLLWLAAALMLVGFCYVLLGPDGFQKRSDGTMSIAARCLLAPYLLGAWINSRLWTRHAPAPALVQDDVWLGRLPGKRLADGFAAIVDLCAELPGSPTRATYFAFPMLDLVTPEVLRLKEAARAIEKARSLGPTLVCCALGYSRSAAGVAAWLLSSGAAATAVDAVNRVRRASPRIVLGDDTIAAIAAAGNVQP